MLKVSEKQCNHCSVKFDLNGLTGKGGQEASNYRKYHENDAICYLLWATALQSPICSTDKPQVLLSCQPS